MGNAIFQIKMIQINENEKKDNIKDIESNNNNTLILGSANHSLVLNENIEHINVISKGTGHKKKASLCSEKHNKTDIGKPINYEKNRQEKHNANVRNNNKTKNKICRICFQEEDDILLNPLIRPCKCSGSMKYIHLKCLLHWLKSRTSNNQMNISNSNDNFNAYFINQNTQCELCKQLFPDYIKHNNIQYCLIDFDYTQEKKIKENNNEQNYANTNMEINLNNDNNSGNKNGEENNENNFIVLDTVFPLTDNNKYRYIVKFNNSNEMKKEEDWIIN